MYVFIYYLSIFNYNIYMHISKVNICVHMRAHTHIDTQRQMRMYPSMNICMCACVRAWVHTHTHIYIYIYIIGHQNIKVTWWHKHIHAKFIQIIPINQTWSKSPANLIDEIFWWGGTWWDIWDVVWLTWFLGSPPKTPKMLGNASHGLKNVLYISLHISMWACICTFILCTYHRLYIILYTHTVHQVIIGRFLTLSCFCLHFLH